MLEFNSKIMPIRTSPGGELPFEVVALEHVAEMIWIGDIERQLFDIILNVAKQLAIDNLVYWAYFDHRTDPHSTTLLTTGQI